MSKKLGFIGAGNMAKAMMGGIIKNKIISCDEIIASDAYAPSLAAAKESLNIETTENNLKVIEEAEVVVLAVKPQYYATVINEIKDHVRENQIIVTIAPGQTLERLNSLFGKDVKIVRTMPNTPALVCEGITGVCHNNLVTKEELDYVCNILSGFGKTEVVSRGFIEGYYGNPWSVEDRAELMKFGGYYKMNTYFYAPKDDPKHKDKWDILYTQDEMHMQNYILIHYPLLQVV